jgi:hypothetical protein
LSNHSLKQLHPLTLSQRVNDYAQRHQIPQNIMTLLVW